MEDSGPLIWSQKNHFCFYLSLTVNIWANDFSSMNKSFLLYKMEMIVRTHNDIKVTEVDLRKRHVNLKAVYSFIYSFSQHYTCTLNSCPRGVSSLEADRQRRWQLQHGRVRPLMEVCPQHGGNIEKKSVIIWGIWNIFPEEGRPLNQPLWNRSWPVGKQIDVAQGGSKKTGETFRRVTGNDGTFILAGA